jgi:hypothetical protein
MCNGFISWRFSAFLLWSGTFTINSPENARKIKCQLYGVQKIEQPGYGKHLPHQWLQCIVQKPRVRFRRR